MPEIKLLDSLPSLKRKSRADTHRLLPQSYLFTGQGEKLIQDFPKQHAINSLPPVTPKTKAVHKGKNDIEKKVKRAVTIHDFKSEKQK
jgi:hypothetical protein